MKWFLVSVGMGSLVLLAGCSKSTDNVSGPSPHALSVLAKADAFDGTADKVVSKCFACNLGMDGKPELSSKAGGYEVHFCNPDCKKSFDADPQKAILAAKIPEPAKK
jgi:YHS domain-containing protein